MLTKEEKQQVIAFNAMINVGSEINWDLLIDVFCDAKDGKKDLKKEYRLPLLRSALCKMLNDDLLDRAFENFKFWLEKSFGNLRLVGKKGERRLETLELAMQSSKKIFARNYLEMCEEYRKDLGIV